MERIGSLSGELKTIAAAAERGELI